MLILVCCVVAQNNALRSSGLPYFSKQKDLVYVICSAGLGEEDTPAKILSSRHPSQMQKSQFHLHLVILPAHSLQARHSARIWRWRKADGPLKEKASYVNAKQNPKQKQTNLCVLLNAM